MQSTVSAIKEAEKSEERYIRVMTPEDGDNKQTWTADDEDSIAIAREVFNNAKKKGMTAYHVKKGGKKGEVMREFDPEAGAVILAPALVGG